jgi:hypothetical protein
MLLDEFTLAFVTLSFGAVLEYLKSTLWSVSSTMTEVIRACQEEREKDPLNPEL